VAHYEAERFSEAIHSFQVAASLIPSADLWFNIARCHEQLARARNSAADYEQAIAYYRRYLTDRVDPPDRAAIEAAAEAMRLAAASGVDCGKVKQALAGGSAASRVLDVMGARMVSRDFAAGIEARLHHKDFGLVLEAARKVGVSMPLTATVAQQLNALMAQGWGRDDTASLLRVLELE